MLVKVVGHYYVLFCLLDLLDKVSNLSVTVFPGPSLSTEVCWWYSMLVAYHLRCHYICLQNVQVSWKKPQKPNGGHVQYYEVSIEFKLSQKEESNFQHSVRDEITCFCSY